jgi:hypothetical protein
MVALAAVVCLIAASPAQAAPKESRIVDASKRVAGFTAGELLGEDFRQLMEIPVDAQFPGSGCLWAGHNNKVLMVWTADPATICTVKPGTPVFLWAYAAECSAVEDPPFFGETEEQQQQCALDFIAAHPASVILVGLDGEPPINIATERFLAISPQLTVDLADPNFVGAPGGQQTTFAVAGYQAMIRPLSPGSHTITVRHRKSPFAPLVQHAVVNVVPGHKN